MHNKRTIVGRAPVGNLCRKFVSKNSSSYLWEIVMHYVFRLTDALRRWVRRWRCTHDWVPIGAYDEACARCGTPRNLFKY